ncbi:hypothetical protein [Agromyces seonyuensis]|uniref:Uncharacterized protein n=1 Tax=Agromyces seonyuensis TaxID=2662446 RepID=A0A6I4NZ26_9MICO|nr:hypothetical protein [Agromyces seonyuensis]MWB96989.1 hypothetical protein [Agromyces seonyuensis]
MGDSDEEIDFTIEEVVVDADEIEGEYTQTGDEAGVLRGVEGQYTETEGVGPDEAVEGSYTGEQVDSRAPQGEYTDADE